MVITLVAGKALIRGGIPSHREEQGSSSPIALELELEELVVEDGEVSISFKQSFNATDQIDATQSSI